MQIWVRFVGVALVDLLEREIFILDVVYTGLHVLAVVNGGGDDADFPRATRTRN